TKTTSTGLTASLAFDRERLVAAGVTVFVPAARTTMVPGAFEPTTTQFVPAGLLVAGLGIRVVTLAIGTVNTFVRDRVSISDVTDIPGRNPSFSLTRILTSNLVASCAEELLLALLRVEPVPLDELAMSVTVPENFRSL